MKGNKPLTTKAIEAMKPGDAEKSDTGESRGLRVRCGKNGKKTFFYRFNSLDDPRKQKNAPIGAFPSLSLSEARVRLAQLKSLRAQGICPAAFVREQKTKERSLRRNETQVKPVDTFTVGDMVELYLSGRIEDRYTASGEVIAGARKKKGQLEVRRMLYRDVVEVLGDFPVESVNSKDIVKLIHGIIDRGASVQAGAVLRELCSSYDYAIGVGKLNDDFVNPAFLAKRVIKFANVKITSKKRSRVLDDNELKRFLEWLPSSGFPDTQKSILRMTLWTGCRTGELCQAFWEDIDLNNNVFHIKDSKNGTSRDVQLCSQAVAYLKVLKLNNNLCVFPSLSTKKPILQKSLSETAWRLRSEGRMIDIADWTAHDLRRTVRTGLAKMGCPSEIAEAVLGHAPKGIVGTYNLHRYNSECREWLQKWANHLDELIETTG
ncbi:tyrosine-type recombinase/integrase [Aeromonas veronii]|uniref:tyrosine-type recombinase/integrase n=1 Tax=Aeromonas sobria TaxID=646 RepID=UPI003A12810E